MKKFIAVLSTLALLMSLCVPFSFAAEVSASLSDPFVANDTDYISFNGEVYEFHYTQDEYGNNIVTCIWEDGTVETVKYNTYNGALYVNDERVPETITPLSSEDVPLEGIRDGNWELLSGPTIHNYFLENLTLTALYAALSAVIPYAPGSALFAAVSAAYGTTVWMSGIEWQFVNFEDYGFKCGMYKHCQVHSGFNGEGTCIFKYNTSVTVR